jgi:hypothetical protein
VIDCSSADFSGAISTGVVFTEKGIVYATTKNPTTSNTKLVDLSSGNTITASAYTLSPSTKYYYRAYIIKSGIVEYGGEGSFSTVACTGNPVDNNFYLNLTADGNQINSRQMKAGQITNECMMSWSGGNTVINLVTNSYIFTCIGFSLLNTVGTYQFNSDSDGEILLNSNPPGISYMLGSNLNFTRALDSDGDCVETQQAYGTTTINITKVTPYRIPDSVFVPDNLREGFIVEGNLSGTIYQYYESCTNSRAVPVSGTFRLISWNI